MRSVTKIGKNAILDTCAVWNVLSSTLLYGTARRAGMAFAATPFVLYECLVKHRGSTLTPGHGELRRRLLARRDQGDFLEVPLSIEDLQEVSILEARRKLGKGELSTLAIARRIGALAFQTDDGKARKLAEAVLPPDRVQTTPQVVGWLCFEGRISDSDFTKVIGEHEEVGRPLRSFFDQMYQEAMRCRLMEQHR
jgi:hypothetical protein